MLEYQKYFKGKGFKKYLFIVFDFISVVVGISLSMVGVLEWGKTGFAIKPKYVMGKNDGNEAVGLIIIGIAFIVYGLIDYHIFRKKRRV